MAIGRMRSFIYIVSNQRTKDSAGFGSNDETVLAAVRAYKELKRATEAWTNRAAFANADALFRFRIIPNLTITTDMVIVCDNERYNIVSVEDVRLRGMYIEALVTLVKPSGR